LIEAIIMTESAKGESVRTHTNDTMRLSFFNSRECSFL